ncbi:MAG TPA: outer membrane beta-barrel protein [Terriglobales bacterium]|nr:outer membrane beta-barrel protein [Terriglobales bacterium]
MNFTKALIFAAILLTGLTAWTQEFPRFETGVNYDYVRFAPGGPYTKGHSLNGGGGSFVYNWNEYLGLKLDLQGYTSNTTGFNIPPNSTFPNGLNGNVQGNLFTYLLGPQFKVRAHKIQPFGHLLFGGAHTNVYGNAFKTLCQPTASACTITKAPTADAFAMDFGGGVDIPINRYISFRPAQIDYLLTRFSNPLSKTTNQNNFHYGVGVVFTFDTRSY